MIIAVDFDGTLCANVWPEIGEPNKALIDFLKSRRKSGDALILWTMREDEYLQKAVKWCEHFGLYFDAVNDNAQSLKDAWQNNPRKVYADWYIDDHNAEHYTDFPKGIY